MFRGWRSKIRQRQWLHKQKLYGYRGGPPEPPQTVNADEAEQDDNDRDD